MAAKRVLRELWSSFASGRIVKASSWAILKALTPHFALPST
jgi:hypothetical protein